jgi:hypothetical protein
VDTRQAALLTMALKAAGEAGMGLRKWLGCYFLLALLTLSVLAWSERGPVEGASEVSAPYRRVFLLEVRHLCRSCSAHCSITRC